MGKDGRFAMTLRINHQISIVKILLELLAQRIIFDVNRKNEAAFKALILISEIGWIWFLFFCNVILRAILRDSGLFRHTGLSSRPGDLPSTT
jgi:hypothetical protein